MPEVNVEDSILLLTKRLLGLDAEVTDFDADLIACINSAINILSQLGVTSADDFAVTSAEDTWTDLLGENSKCLNMAKTYIFTKTKIMFDPPTTGAVMQAYKDVAHELECRINYQVDPSAM